MRILTRCTYCIESAVSMVRICFISRYDEMSLTCKGLDHQVFVNLQSIASLAKITVTTLPIVQELKVGVIGHLTIVDMAMSEFPSRASDQSFSRPRSLKDTKDAKDAVHKDEGCNSPAQNVLDKPLPDRPEGARQDSAIDLCSDEQRRSQVSKVDTVSPFSVHPDDIPCDFSLFDFPPSSRLSRPFVMPTLVTRKRGSTISRRSVVSVEIIADIVKSRRLTQDSDTLSPTCLSPSELQRLYEDCIGRHPAFINGSTAAVLAPSRLEMPEPVFMQQPAPFNRHSDPAVSVRDSSQRRVTITPRASKVHRQHKWSIMDMGREKFSDRLEASNQDLAETKAKLQQATSELDRRNRHAQGVEMQVASMKKGMEDAMRAYRDATRELSTLKESHAECAPSMPAQVLSIRQRKIQSEYKLQRRYLEQKLSTTMADLRCVERKWKEGQLLLNSCYRDSEKQKLVVRDCTEDLRMAEAAKANLNEMLDKAQEELRATREQLADVEASTSDALASSKEKARRFEKRVSQIEAECEDTRSKLKDMKQRASLSAVPDQTLAKQLMMAKTELKDREELLGVVKQTNADLARKIAEMEMQLGRRKY